MIRERLPHMPVYLLSLLSQQDASAKQASIDEELFMACVQAGGARGMIETSFVECALSDWESRRDQFAELLLECTGRLYRQKAAERMGMERKVMTFDAVPAFNREDRDIVIRLRNLRMTRALAAADAGEVLADVERPRTRFDDVIGADTAKEELKFFIENLRNPKRFAALGIKPPKGVLLYGPPGTGKTMLARAMAGESEVAFVAAAASNFVTVWQGSGPQNVRDLFAKARRYAPAIVFIDEIDAIGRTRTGGPGGGHGEEMALNALLTEMDGFTSPSADRPVFVLAATNFNVKSEDPDHPERSFRSLDPALVRRFSRQILVDLPDRAARKKYFELRLAEGKSGRISPATIDLLAEKSPGMSISHLEGVIETAARTAIQRGTELTDAVLLEALDTAARARPRRGRRSFWNAPCAMRRDTRCFTGRLVGGHPRSPSSPGATTAAA